MRLLGKQHIEDFVSRYPQSRSALTRWKKIIEETTFKNLAQLKQAFNAVDLVGEYTVFNIKGNHIRTITIIEYGISQVLITDVLTHSEYDRAKWKK